MDIESAVTAVRAIRHFAPTPLKTDDLRAIVDAGRRAGSSKNLQRWHFIVVQDRSLLTALAGVGDSAQHVAGAAAAIALVTPDPRTPSRPLSVVWDLGRAAQNMVLVAWSRGIGSVPATVYNHDLSRELLGYPADLHCEYVLSFGYPAAGAALSRPARAGGRRGFDDVVRWERW